MVDRNLSGPRSNCPRTPSKPIIGATGILTTLPLDEGEVVTGGTDTGRSLGTGSDQRRLYATAAIVGVVTLVLGLLIGRSGGGDDVSTSSPTTPVTSEASSSSTARRELAVGDSDHDAAAPHDDHHDTARGLLRFPCTSSRSIRVWRGSS